MIARARDLLARAAEREGCAWCRSHVLAVKMLADDLVQLARLSDDMRESPGMRRLLVRVTRLGEEWGVLTLMARVFHRLRHWWIGLPAEAAIF